MDRRISSGLEEIVEKRSLYIKENGSEEISVTRDGGSHYVNCAMPILCEGDVIGCVFSAEPYNSQKNKQLSTETEIKLIQTAGVFLGKQMES